MKGMALQERESVCVRMLLSLVAHPIGYKMVVGAHNTVYVRRLWQALPCSPRMANDGAPQHYKANVGTYNTVRQMSAPTTLFGP